MDRDSSRRSVYNRAHAWLSECVGQPEKRNRARIITASAIVFLVAFGVRLLHWQDINVEVHQGQTMMMSMATVYRQEARRILEEGSILFPKTFDDPTDARMLLHPPGYSILMFASYFLFGGSDTAVRQLQIIFDAAAAVIVLLIAAELLPPAVAIIAGLLVALSPHLAYYSLWLGPDSLAAMPILVAVFLIIRASKRPRQATVIAAGALLGLSCWLRSNVLTLAPFLTIAMVLLFERGKRLRYSVALVVSTLAVISPITIRNLILYRSFVPLSVGAGITMVEGIADYDRDRRFGMPFTDKEVAQMDADRYARPDYAGNPWVPDGIERDRARLTRGLGVIRSDPVWFVGVMIRRAGFMLEYNDSRRRGWPFGTAIVPIVSSEATFSHDFITDGAELVWANSPADLIGDGAIKSPLAEFKLAYYGQALQLTGDGSDFGDQLTSTPIPVQKNSDCLLTLPVKLEQGHLAAKVTSADLRIALASVIIPDAELDARKWAKRKAKQRTAGTGDVESTDERPMSVIDVPFASGNRDEVRLVMSNNGTEGVRPTVQLGRAELFAMGPTPYLWTRYPRAVIRALQKNLFTTSRMLPLILIGIALLAIAKRGRVLAIVLAVPVYYLCVQSTLHTEYRYILPIHYFLFVTSATTLYCAGAAISQAGRRVYNLSTRHRTA